MSKTRVAVEVRNGNFEKALSIFNSKIKKSGILKEYKESQVYKKPSQLKNERNRKKRHNLRKK